MTKRQFVFITICLLLLSGCWDAKDIDQRSFVMGVAFDLAEGDEEEHVMTIEIPLLENFASNQGGSQQEETTLILSTTGKTVAQMSGNFEPRTWREIFYGHTQVIIIGEEVARNGIAEFIDYFDRNPRIDRRLKLFIAQGEAREVFNAKNPLEPTVSNYLNQLLEVATRTSTVIKQNFQDSLRNLEHNGDTILPRVRGTDKEVEIAGGAVIKDYKFIAWLGENETRAAAFLYDNITGGSITVNIDEVFYTYAIRSSSTKIKAKLEGEQLTFFITVESSGDIIEIFQKQLKTPVDTPIEKVQAKLNADMKDEILHLLHKLQDLKADPIGFSKYVFRHFPKYWKEHRDEWKDVIFPQVKFEVQTKFTIQSTGILE